MAKNSKITMPQIDEGSIYEGGNFNAIKISDLENNPVAIKQLLNDYQQKSNELKAKREEVIELKLEVQHLKTAPFIAIKASFINISGTIILGIGVNFISTQNAPNYSYLLVGMGFLLVLIGSVGTILYPSARKFFNKTGDTPYEIVEK